MQYNFGTIRLIMSLVIILGFQVLIALPFVLNESSVADYIQRSKLTGAGRNGIAHAAAFWDYLAAHQSLSLFWTFLPEEVYFDKSRMADPLKVAQLTLNVYHFFLRKWCLPQCFTNLFRTFDSKHTQTLTIDSHHKARKTLEILVIGYFCGVVLMPGANGQFQFWFICLVPLLISMTGVPLVLTFWVTEYFYPFLHGDPQYQHYLILGLTAWLITVGP
mmetsp:Transcript_13063/g.22047  ORF Transcript_13063/g.22047 Transcript_13063/m.22047 type:complete len:218 (+) Transcript_13063:559-1212(+)